MMKRNTHNRTAKLRRRSGYLYVSVLCVASIVSIVGFTAMSLARTRLTTSVLTAEQQEAKLLSSSAIEVAMTRINHDSAWRTTHSNDVETPETPISLGNGSLTYKLIDADGNLSDDSDDLATLYGIGRVGDAVHVQSVVIHRYGGEMEIVAGSWRRSAALD